MSSACCCTQPDLERVIAGVDDPDVQRYLLSLGAPSNPAARQPGHVRRAGGTIPMVGDQLWDGEFELVPPVGALYGKVFVSHFIQNGVSFWEEKWVVHAWAAFNAGPAFTFVYKSPQTDADAYIYGLKQQNPNIVLYRMDTLSVYEQFDLSAPPVSQLPTQTPASLTKTVHRVSNKIAGTQAPQGVLYREHRDQVNPSTGKPEQLRIEHWVLYGGYQMPQDPTVSTVVEADPALSFTSPHAFATAVATTIAPADGGVPQWFVRTNAVFQQV